MYLKKKEVSWLTWLVHLSWIWYHSSTKVIDQTGGRIGSKKTTVLRNAHPSLHSRSQPPQPAKPKPPPAPQVNFTKRPSPSYSSQGHAVSPHHLPTTVTSTKPTSPSLTTTTTSSSNSSSSSNGSSSRQAGNPAVMSMPYR